MSASVFQLSHTETSPYGTARAGILHTAHGPVHTPIFMPVGTQASIKAVSQQAIAQYIQPDIILANNYHLFLRPGSNILAGAGGLHCFMHWHGPILTDSGGFQVYSLGHLRKVKDDGVIFASHIDGSRHKFTPDNVVEMQRVIGSDIMMVLDECVENPAEYRYAREAMDRTHRWAAQAREAFTSGEGRYGFQQLQFGIVQGSTYADLRRASCEAIAGLAFDGNAIGGLAVGEEPAVMYDTAQLCCEALPTHKPRYLMGVGTPTDLLNCIARGVDMFDCVMPSRNARHGLLFYRDGIRNLKNAKYKDDFSPLDPTSSNPIDQYYNKAYLRHLFIADEYLAYEIATIHNLHFYLALVREARAHIMAGTFSSWFVATLPSLSQRV